MEDTHMEDILNGPHHTQLQLSQHQLSQLQSENMPTQQPTQLHQSLNTSNLCDPTLHQSQNMLIQQLTLLQFKST